MAKITEIAPNDPPGEAKRYESMGQCDWGIPYNRYLRLALSPWIMCIIQ